MFVEKSPICQNLWYDVETIDGGRRFVWVDIAERIIKLNEKRGWSVYRLAKEAKISSSTLTNMMRRGTCPSLTTLERLCEAYGITLAEFLYDQEDLIHLNEAQKRHLDRWNLLTERQKRAVELFIDGLRQIE